MYPMISLKQLEEMLDRKEDVVLVDLRNPRLYRQWHIKDAVNIPFSGLMENLNRLSSEKPNVFYCSRGSNSLLACNRLSSMGFSVVCVAGGMDFYRGKYREYLR